MWVSSTPKGLHSCLDITGLLHRGNSIEKLKNIRARIQDDVIVTGYPRKFLGQEFSNKTFKLIIERL